MAAVMTAPRTYTRPTRGRSCGRPYEDGRIVPPARPMLTVVAEPVVHPRRRVRSRAVYWRRRVVVTALALGTVALAGRAGVALGGSPLASSERRPPLTSSSVVRTGDTLWDVARRLVPGSDPRPVVDQIDNARHHAPLVPGETVVWQP